MLRLFWREGLWGPGGQPLPAQAPSGTPFIFFSHNPVPPRPASLCLPGRGDPVQLLLRPFRLLNVTMHMSVLSVPPEAVNMSLGLSLAFATNPFRLLVSCPWVTGVSERRRGDLGLLGLGSCRGWRCWGKRTEIRGQPLLPTPAFQACGPTLHQTCKENTYVNGFCFLFGSNLRQPPQRFPKALRGRLLGTE